MITYDSIRKITTGQGDHLLDYNYFKSYYKMVAIDLRKQQALDADPKAIQQISFYWKSKSSKGSKNVFHYSRSKRNLFRFFTRKCKKSLILFFALI